MDLLKDDSFDQHVNVVITKVYEAWDLNNSLNVDSEAIKDIMSAIREAYIKGIQAGGLDKSLFHQAIDMNFDD